MLKRMREHTCHAVGCNKITQPKRLMCLKHWQMVPQHLKNQVWEHYKPGQEILKNPSLHYLNVVKTAIKWVLDHEKETAKKEL